MSKLEEIYKGEDNDTTMPVVKNMTKSAWIVMEAMMLNPKITQRELAKLAGVSRPYVCRIQNSPVFKQTLREARIAAVQDRLVNMTDKGITRAEQIIEDSESSDKDALAALKLGLTAMGMGANQGTPAGAGDTNLTVNLGVTADMVNEARERSQKKKLIEGTCTEVSDEQSE